MNKALEEKIAQLEESLKGVNTLRAERDAARAEVSSLRSELYEASALLSVIKIDPVSVRALGKIERYEDVRAERNRLQAELSALRAEIEAAPEVFIDEDSDIWVPEQMDMKGTRIRARLVRIEKIEGRGE